MLLRLLTGGDLESEAREMDEARRLSELREATDTGREPPEAKEPEWMDVREVFDARELRPLCDSSTSRRGSIKRGRCRCRVQRRQERRE